MASVDEDELASFVGVYWFAPEELLTVLTDSEGLTTWFYAGGVVVDAASLELLVFDGELLDAVVVDAVDTLFALIF